MSTGLESVLKATAGVLRLRRRPLIPGRGRP